MLTLDQQTSTANWDKVARLLGGRLRNNRTAALQEVTLHELVAAALNEAGVSFEREHRITAQDRLDFWIPESGWAVEVKKDRAGIAELQQIGRYLTHPQVRGCAVIAKRITDIPATFMGKPIARIPFWVYFM